jgi:flagellar basal-body rod protein FlgC
MGAFDGLDVSGSGMEAYRTWMESSAANVANAHTTRTAAGGPYRRQIVRFAEVLTAAEPGAPPSPKGVRVADVTGDPTAFPRIHDPSHPDADAQGFLSLPNVDPVREMADLAAASRAYEANVAAFGTTKRMLLKSLEIGR